MLLCTCFEQNETGCDVTSSTGDGTVTFEEFRSFVSKREVFLREAYAKIDRNHDGSISKEELAVRPMGTDSAKSPPPPPQESGEVPTPPLLAPRGRAECIVLLGAFPPMCVGSSCSCFS
jgi:hypothetical protein